MELKNFSFGDALKFAVNAPFKQPIPVLKLVLFTGLCTLVAGLVGAAAALILNMFRTETGAIGAEGYQLVILVGLIALVCAISAGIRFYAWAGATRILLKIVRQLPLQTSDFVISAKDLFFYALTLISYILLCTLGLIALIIPGLYAMMSYIFAPVVAIDRGSSVSQNFTFARKMVWGAKMKLFLSYFLISLVFAALLAGIFFIIRIIFPAITPDMLAGNVSNIAIAQIIFLPLGILFSVMWGLFYIHIYQQLLDQTEKSDLIKKDTV